MKLNKIISSVAFLTVLSLTASQTYAQIIVKVRPARPAVAVVRRPPPPSPRHIWVDEDWVQQGGRYVWHGGYWIAPPRPGSFFIKGHWRNTRRGSVWIPGHWR